MKGIGIDTVAMAKFQHVMLNSGDGFIEHVFTKSERKYCAGTSNALHSFAAHFAAKEALIKAMPTLRNFGVDWRDIEVSHNSFGSPQFVMTNNLSENMRRVSATNVLLSISHTHETAVAMVAVI